MSDNKPVPMKIEGSVTLKINSELTTGDLVDSIITDTEESLIIERDNHERTQVDLNKKHSDLGKKLVEQGNEASKSVKADKEAEALAKALQAFTGVKHETVVFANDGDGVIDVEKQIITVTVGVMNSKTAELYRKNARKYSYSSGSTYGAADAEHSKQVEIKFTADMKKTVKEIEEVTAQLRDVHDKLQETRRKIADLPRMARRAKAAIVKGQLEGKIQDGQDIVNLLGQITPKALPNKLVDSGCLE